MTKPVTKVVYKPDNQSTEEYILIVNRDEYKKWKAGDGTIPLADVVDSFEIFHSTQGSQGKLGRASNQQLDNVFGTHKDIDAVQKLLESGTLHASEGISASSGSTNVTRSSVLNDTRGKGLAGI